MKTQEPYTEVSLQEVNQKLDFLLEEMQQQKMRRLEMQDLMKDMSIISKDLFESTVNKLDNAGVELDTEALETLVLQMVRNIKNFSVLMSTVESGMDLWKDMSPILQQVILDVTARFEEFEQKGYFKLMEEMLKFMDKLFCCLKPEDIQALTENAHLISGSLRNLSNPEVLKAIHQTSEALKETVSEEQDSKNLFGLLRTLNSKEGKQTLGFLSTLIQNLSPQKT